MKATFGVWCTCALPVILAFLCSNGKAEILRKKVKPEVDRPRLYRDGTTHLDSTIQNDESDPAVVETTANSEFLKSDNLEVRNNIPEFTLIGEPGDDNWPADGRLGICEADCDRDEQCKEGLKCFQRKGSEHVPGCSGVPIDGEDYCYDPNTPSPSASPSLAPSGSAPTMSPAPSHSPTPRPTTGPPTQSPSYSPTSSPAPSPAPSQAPSRTALYTFGGENKPLLRKCEGSCSNDDECADGLLCQKRTAFETVTGCDGRGEPGDNYCYDPQDGPAVPQLPNGSFRLREYWEEGYFWQETYAEAHWCMHEDGYGRSPQIQRCRGSSTKYEFIYLEGPGDMIKVRGRNMCLERTGNQNVTMQGCDRGNLDQRWKGNWISRRFDIRPLRREGCLTQHHHPRPGEHIYIASCWTAHMTNTGYWNME